MALKLAKAIGIYNGAKWRMLNYSWPRMIKYLKYDENSKANSGSICHSCKYSILVRNHAGIFKNHLRTYVWEGAAADETDPVNGARWCFKYGEEEWINPEDHPLTGKPLSFFGYRDLATADESKRVNCE